jgi:hypothetical protein
MAHFAKVENGTVTQVIVAEPEFFDTFVDTTPGEWIKTSYNMRGGVYYEPATNEPAADQSVIAEDEARGRKNYAGIGFTYDRERDAFIPPQPYASWALNEESCLWEPPIPYPNDGALYQWDEDTANWVAIEVTE